VTPEVSLVQQVGAVARRSVTRTLRQRALLVFPVLFPLILFAINGSALSAATKIPGFPTDSYRAFALAIPFIQGALFVSISAGTDLARDIETGFFNRLALTPLRGSALLIGQLGGAFVVAALQSVVNSDSQLFAHTKRQIVAAFTACIALYSTASSAPSGRGSSESSHR